MIQTSTSSLNVHFLEFLQTLGWPQGTSKFSCNRSDFDQIHSIPSDFLEEFCKQMTGLITHFERILNIIPCNFTFPFFTCTIILGQGDRNSPESMDNHRNTSKVNSQFLYWADGVSEILFIIPGLCFSSTSSVSRIHFRFYISQN